MIRQFTLPKPTWAHNNDPDEFVVLLAGNTLNADVVHEAGQIITNLGSTPGDEQVIKLHRYARLQCNATPTQAFELFEALHAAFVDLDVLVIPQSECNKRLIVCDMDSTIIQTESLDELADYMGIGSQIAAITERAMNGELDFHEALNERVAMLKGLPYSKVEECVNQTKYNPGARELLNACTNAGMRTVLVSGGFAPFVKHVANDLGFDHWVANELEIADQKLTGKVLAPIVDKATKLEVLLRECAEMDIDPVQSCTVGDGANDIDMLTAAGLGIAWRAKKVVLDATPYHLNHSGLQTISWLLETHT